MKWKYGYVCRVVAHLELLCTPFEKHEDPRNTWKLQRVLRQVNKVLSPHEMHHVFDLGEDYRGKYDTGPGGQAAGKAGAVMMTR